MIKIHNCIKSISILCIPATLIQLSNGQIRAPDVYLSEVEFDSNNTIAHFQYDYQFREIFHKTDYYNPVSVMLPPKSWSNLCGSTIPYATKKEIQAKSSKDGLVHNDDYVWVLLNNRISSNSSCSTAEKMENIEKLNSYLIKYTYGRTRGIISKLILHGGCDIFPSKYVNHIDLLVVESYSEYLSIETHVLQHENTTGINSHLFDTESNNWSYYMTITKDMDFDGKTGIDDYRQYIGQQQNDEHSASPHSNKLVGFLAAGGSIAILSFVVLFAIHKKRNPTLPSNQPRQEISNDVRRRQQHIQSTGRNTNRTPGRITNSSNITNNNTSNSVSLSEDDFASLPQMIYHEKKKQEEIAMPSIDEETPPPPPPSAIVATTIECNLPNTTGVLSSDADISVDQNNSRQVVPTLDNITDIKNIESALEEITNSTINNNEHQQSLSYFRTKFGVSLKAIECCSICLEEFAENEVVTALPQCCHLFHTACIGQWLLERKSNQCPMCKCNVLKQK
jgi:Ring finger domain